MKKFLIFILFTPVILFAKTTSSAVVAIELSGGSEVGFVRVSSNESFLQFREFPFDSQKPIIQWNVCYPNTTCTPGEKNVFVQYLDTAKNVLGTANQTITYEKPKLIQKQITPSALPTPKQTPFIPIVNIPTSPELSPVVSEIFGCTDILATNYDPYATTNNSSCIFQEKHPSVLPQNTIISVGITAGILQTIFLFFGYGMKFAEFPLLLSRAITQSLIFIGVRKRPIKWGTVTDVTSGQGLDPVLVTLFNINNKVIQTAITDIEGRFGFLVPPGEYRLFAQKTHYIFPSDHGYRGEVFSVTDQGVVTMDIPLQPVSTDWNEQEKQKTLSWLMIHRKKIQTIFSLSFFISCILSLWMMISNPIWVNGVFLGINIIFLGIRLMTKSKRSFGLIYDKNKRPVFGASIQYSFTTTPNMIIKKVVTDQFGRYYILAKNGTYQCTITHNNKIIKKDTIHITNGLFAKDFQV